MIIDFFDKNGGGGGDAPIQTIKVNGEIVTPENKTVNIKTPDVRCNDINLLFLQSSDRTEFATLNPNSQYYLELTVHKDGKPTDNYDIATREYLDDEFAKLDINLETDELMAGCFNEDWSNHQGFSLSEIDSDIDGKKIVQLYAEKNGVIKTQDLITKDYFETYTSGGSQFIIYTTTKGDTHTLYPITSDATLNYSTGRYDISVPSLTGDYEVLGLMKYELKNGGNRVDAIPVYVFSMEGQTILRIGFKTTGSTNKTITTATITILLKKRS